MFQSTFLMWLDSDKRSLKLEDSTNATAHVIKIHFVGVAIVARTLVPDGTLFESDPLLANAWTSACKTRASALASFIS
jgi:hypothetical protein